MREIKKQILLFGICTLLVNWLGTAYANRHLERINQVPPIPDVVARVNGSDIGNLDL